MKKVKEIAENIQVGDVVSVLGYDGYSDRSWDTAAYAVVKSIPRRGEYVVQYLDSEAEFVTVSSSEIELADEMIASQYRRNNKFKYIFEKIIEKQANRIAGITPLTDEILCSITRDDIPDQKDLRYERR